MALSTTTQQRVGVIHIHRALLRPHPPDSFATLLSSTPGRFLPEGPRREEMAPFSLQRLTFAERARYRDDRIAFTSRSCQILTAPDATRPEARWYVLSRRSADRR